MDRSPDDDTNFFDIIAGVLQGDKFAPYLSIISLDYALRASIDLIKKFFMRKEKARSRRYTAETMTDADYADNLALLSNTIAHVESLLHCQEQAAGNTPLRERKKKNLCILN